MKLSDMTIEQAAQALKTWTQHREYDFIAPFLALPGLRGFWPMSAFDASANVFDQSGNVRTMAAAGTPRFGYDGLAPYAEFDGSGDYLTRADETALDVTGGESYVVTPGLTLGGWFYFDNAASANEGLITKWLASANLSYMLCRTSGGVGAIQVTSDGTSGTQVTSAASVLCTVAGWNFIAGRVVPSTTLDLWQNGTQYTNSTSIPAAIHAGSANFVIGGWSGGTGLLTGRASLCFLCAAALSDDIVSALYQRTRPLFGV